MTANLIVIHCHTADWVAFNSRVLLGDDLTRQCAHVVCSCNASCTAAIRQRRCTDIVVRCQHLNMILHTACSVTLPLTSDLCTNTASISVDRRGGVAVPHSSMWPCVPAKNSTSVRCLCVGLIFGQNITYFFSCVAI